MSHTPDPTAPLNREAQEAVRHLDYKINGTWDSDDWDEPARTDDDVW